MSETIITKPVGSDFVKLTAAQRYSHSVVQDRRTRLGVVVLLMLLASVAVVCRLYALQFSEAENWRLSAVKQHSSKILLAPARGQILDREDRIMAVSVPAGSVFVRPLEVKESERVVQTLAKLLELEPSKVQEKLKSTQKFVWVKRQVPKALAEQISELKLAGVGHLIESRRLYPYNHAAGHLIGRVGIDGNGLAGIEAKYDKTLSPRSVEAFVQKDALGNIIDIGDSESLVVEEVAPLKLTLDGVIQMIVDQELLKAKKTAKAKSVRALMIDAGTGEILALGQVPHINQNVGGNFDPKLLHNEIVESVFEPGSIFKPIVAAAAIDQGLTTAQEMVDCEMGSFRFGRREINDVHPAGVISLHDVIVRSSNIGISKVVIRMGAERLYRSLRDFGFGTRVELGLPGETPGILRRPQRWSAVDVATHSFGQGVAVNSLQMVRGFSALVNGGYLPRIKFVRDQVVGAHVLEREQVISPETSKIVRAMLRDVVEAEHGTGGKAAVEGFEVGGKTGTAQKADSENGGYKAGAYVASFVGYLDLSPIGQNRILTLLVSVDEPRGGVIYGGALAGPAFSKIMQRTTNYLATRSQLEKKANDKT
jgi:cell division protein FtsI (penicillin-binding protein 3)